MVRNDSEPAPVIGHEAVIRSAALPAVDEYQPGPVAARTADIVTPVPGWLLAAGAVFVAAVIVVCFLVFWRGMGTAPRQSAVEAFGVAFGLMVVVSLVGAFVQAARDARPDGDR